MIPRSESRRQLSLEALSLYPQWCGFCLLQVILNFEDRPEKKVSGQVLWFVIQWSWRGRTFLLVINHDMVLSWSPPGPQGSLACLTPALAQWELSCPLELRPFLWLTGPTCS